MSVQALIADLLAPVSPPPRANKATGTRGERGEKGENPRPVWSGERANMGESGAKRGESSDAPADSPAQFAQNSPLFAPDSPVFAPPRTRAITEDSPNSPLSPKVHGASHSPGEPESSIERLERLHEETGRMIERALRDAKIRANAEAIGDDLERRLIEGSEALAKIRPADPDTDPAPLATATLVEIDAWMNAAGETDIVTRNEVLVGYGFDPGFQYPDSGRRTCRQCRNLDADGGCRAARRGQIPNASRHYTWPNGIEDPHRCVGFREVQP